MNARVIKMEQIKPDGKKVYNQFAAAEMSKEDNYNKIDGVLNNTKKPTYEEKLKIAQEKRKATATQNKKKVSEHSNSRDNDTGARRMRHVR